MSEIEKIKQLRQSTGAGFKDCNTALKESNGDLNKAVEILRIKGISKASKKMSREAKEGVVAISGDEKKTSIIEVNCETDFVAKTDDFLKLARNIAMQIAATNPMSLDRDSIDQTKLEKEKEILLEQAKSSGKPESILDKIVDGRIEKYFQENCLLEQPYIKDADKSVQDILTESIATLGENISIARFARFEVGDNSNLNNSQ